MAEETRAGDDADAGAAAGDGAEEAPREGDPGAGAASGAETDGLAHRPAKTSAEVVAQLWPKKRPSIFESERPGWEFIQRLPGKKLAIWTAFLALIWVLRDFFDIIIVTFVISYITGHVVDILEARTGRRKLCTTAVFTVLVGVLVLVVSLATPRLIDEGKELVKQASIVSKSELESASLHAAMAQEEGGFRRLATDGVRIAFTSGENKGEEGVITRVIGAEARIELAEPLTNPISKGDAFRLTSQPADAPPYEVTDAVMILDPTEKIMESLSNFLGEDRLEAMKEYYEKTEAKARVNESIGDMLETVGAGLKKFLNGTINAVFHFLASILFSFMIVLGMPKLRSGVKSLAFSRFGDVYEEVGPSVSAFGELLGKAFEAQTMIAVVNTVLTFIGMWILGIKGKLFLSLIVFACSFIPVLGVAISTVPIALIALKDGGVGVTIGVFVMVALVHVLEAYVLNPYIYGAHLSLHPLAVLIILLTAEHTFGLWGLVLGVPVSAYIYEHVIWGGRREEVERATGPPIDAEVVATATKG